MECKFGDERKEENREVTWKISEMMVEGGEIYAGVFGEGVQWPYTVRSIWAKDLAADRKSLALIASEFKPAVARIIRDYRTVSYATATVLAEVLPSN